MLTIDGSQGEGGGQILRTSLALSTCLGQAFRISHIRAARKNPGLQPQHLAAVRAAAEISNARLEGAEKDSQYLFFEPGKVNAGEYIFSIGTAGSTMLVLQTVLPALMLASRPSTLVFEGGTHNPFAPPFEFLSHTYLPIIQQMGPIATASLERAGFAPKGGGKVRLHIQPVPRLQTLELTERGEILQQQAKVILAHLPLHIAQREVVVIQQALALPDSCLELHVDEQAYGPGNVVSVLIMSQHVTECFSAFGQRGLPAERVADDVVRQVLRYLKAGVPVGQHLADQLLLPLALAGQGRFVTLKPSSHTLTNIQVIKEFMDISIHIEEHAPDVWYIHVS